jgi:hypothetical protein
MFHRGIRQMVSDWRNGEQLMKKLILLLLLIPSLAWGQVSTSGVSLSGCSSGGVSAAAAPYCTGDNECTATTPGSCDLLCEDFESNQHCVDNASYDSVCRAEHRFLVAVGGTGAIDYTTAHSGTFACTDKGSNAAKVTVSAGDSTAFYISSLSNAAGNDTYVEFYVNINSLTLDDTKRQGIHTGLYTGLGNLWTLRVLRTGSVYNLEATCRGCASAGVGSTDLASYLDGSTWLRIGIAAKQSDNTFKVYLNGEQDIATKTDYSGDATFIGAAFGAGGDSLREGDSVMQYDNISISATALPGGCN